MYVPELEQSILTVGVRGVNAEEEIPYCGREAMPRQDLIINELQRMFSDWKYEVDKYL